jgi:uncharacterized damage-inducible protein DinB
MYRSIQDFLDDWREESASTLKIFKALTDESLNQRVTPQGRSLGRLAWHLVGTLNEMMNRTGLQVEGPDEHAPQPATASELVAAYERGSSSVAREVQKHWKDADLSVEIDMYGERWPKRLVLLSLIRHQAHHRAQMTVLMRQAGLAVPGVYGPSKEEWSSMGMKPME